MIFVSLLDGRGGHLWGGEHVTPSVNHQLSPFSASLPSWITKAFLQGDQIFPAGLHSQTRSSFTVGPGPSGCCPAGKMNAGGSQPKTLPWLQESCLSSLQVASLDSIFEVPSVSICMYQWVVIWSGISSILKTLFSELWFKDPQGGSEPSRETGFLLSGTMNKGCVSKQNKDKSKTHTIHKCDTLASHCGSCFQEYPPESFSC